MGGVRVESNEYAGIVGPHIEMNGRNMILMWEQNNGIGIIAKHNPIATFGNVCAIPSGEIQADDGELIELWGSDDPYMPPKLVKLSVPENARALFFSSRSEDALPIVVFPRNDTVCLEEQKGLGVGVRGNAIVRVAYRFRQGEEIKFHCIYFEARRAVGTVGYDPNDWFLVRKEAPTEMLCASERDELKYLLEEMGNPDSAIDREWAQYLINSYQTRDTGLIYSTLDNPQ